MVSSISFTQEDTTKQISNCKFAVNEVDDFSGNLKMILKSELLISYTDSSLVKYYKNKPHQYAECTIECGKINSTFVSYVSWRIDNDEAYKFYGAIYEEAKFMIKFVDGSTITLNFAKTDVGETNYQKKYTTYDSYIILDDIAIKELQSKPISKIRMYWSKGYDDYEVVNTNLFISQLNCLK